MRFKDKVAIVTGGGGGIGREIVKILAGGGAKVMVCDLVIGGANRVVSEAEELGGEVVAMEVDITKIDEVTQLVKATLGKFGKIDILENVAGGSAGPVIKTKQGAFAQSNKERWEDMINLNLFGTLNCTWAVINHMIERHTGKIVSFGSTAGVIGMQGGVSYSAAKAGVIGFTRALAKEVAPYGINVNCVSPGVVGSERLFTMSKEWVEGWRQSIFLGKFATPRELADTATFLASDESSHITGQNIIVDGGLSLGPKNY